jgi:DNA-directed RNA polymerase subunit F
MPRILEERLVTLSEVKRILSKIGEDKLNEFQRRTLDFAKKFSKIDVEKAHEIQIRLEELRVPRDIVVQIVNCMPNSIEELRTFFIAAKRFVVTARLEEILKILDEYRK